MPIHGYRPWQYIGPEVLRSAICESLLVPGHFEEVHGVKAIFIIILRCLFHCVDISTANVKQGWVKFLVPWNELRQGYRTIIAVTDFIYTARQPRKKRKTASFT